MGKGPPGPVVQAVRQKRRCDLDVCEHEATPAALFGKPQLPSKLSPRQQKAAPLRGPRVLWDAAPGLRHQLL